VSLPRTHRGDATRLTHSRVFPAEERWLQDVPWGFRALLNYLFARYQKPIYVTENGFAIKGESGLSKEKALREFFRVCARCLARSDREPFPLRADDTDRVQFYTGYLNALREAVLVDKVSVLIPAHLLLKLALTVSLVPLHQRCSVVLWLVVDRQL
jgi:hypothetical protein